MSKYTEVLEFFMENRISLNRDQMNELKDICNEGFFSDIKENMKKNKESKMLYNKFAKEGYSDSQIHDKIMEYYRNKDKEEQDKKNQQEIDSYNYSQEEKEKISEIQSDIKSTYEKNKSIFKSGKDCDNEDNIIKVSLSITTFKDGANKDHYTLAYIDLEDDSHNTFEYDGNEKYFDMRDRLVKKIVSDLKKYKLDTDAWDNGRTTILSIDKKDIL